ncbi:hypothetical protein GW17_00026989 [Ensete ventricosum]|nr:hypothetical protein GW17_00026989 [Ensete ventricosum]RZR97070.1 hypothetical protein BHM03_00026182 [Ensete ventricosum]
MTVDLQFLSFVFDSGQGHEHCLLGIEGEVVIGGVGIGAYDDIEEEIEGTPRKRCNNFGIPLVAQSKRRLTKLAPGLGHGADPHEISRIVQEHENRRGGVRSQPFQEIPATLHRERPAPRDSTQSYPKRRIGEKGEEFYREMALEQIQREGRAAREEKPYAGARNHESFQRSRERRREKRQMRVYSLPFIVTKTFA